MFRDWVVSINNGWVVVWVQCNFINNFCREGGNLYIWKITFKLKLTVMIRIDQSDYLIHFTKGRSNNSGEAYNNFWKIFSDGELIGGTGYIKGGYKCVCFTESPIGCLVQDRNKSKSYLENIYFKRYSPFGFHFPKNHIHGRGGRQVIYSTDAEYEDLPKSFKWRFVLYKPRREKKDNIDFTWEREWRIRENFKFDKRNVKLVFPNRDWINKFIKDYGPSLPLDCISEKETTILKIANLFEPVSKEIIKIKCVDISDFPNYLIDLGLENYK